MFAHRWDLQGLNSPSQGLEERRCIPTVLEASTLITILKIFEICKKRAVFDVFSLQNRPQFDPPETRLLTKSSHMTIDIYADADEIVGSDWLP